MAGTGIYGELLKAQLENLSSDPGSTSVGRLYWNTTTQSARIYTSSGWDDFGGGGSGASGRNYLSDWFDGDRDVGSVTNSITATGNITISTSLWQASDTAAKLTIARTSSSPLRQTYSLLLDNIGAGAAFVQTPCFLLDAADLGKPVTVSFDVANVVTSDDYQVYAVRYNSAGTYQERIVIAGTASATPPYSARIPTGTTKFQGFFVAGSTSTDYYVIRFYRNSESDTTDIKVDSLYVGPEKVVQGAGITDPVSFTPTNSNSSWTQSGSALYWSQFGPYMHIHGYIQLTASNAQDARLNLPESKTVGLFSGIVGKWWRNSNSATTRKTGTVFGALGEAYLSFSSDDYTSAVYPNATTTDASTLWNTTDAVYVDIWVPISGWSSNVTMADRAVEEQCATSGTWDADDTGLTNLVRGYTGGAITGALTTSRTKRVRFSSAINVSDDIEIKFSRGAGQVYTLSAQFIDGSGNRIVNSESSAQTIATSSGVYWRPVSGSNTDIDIIFARYAALANDDSPAQDWVNGWYWIANKVSGGAAVGFPIGADNVVINHNSTATSSTLKSGTYTPTFTNVTNVASTTLRSARYTQVGNVVTVSINVSIATTAAAPTQTQMRVSVPVSSNFTTDYQAAGGGSRYRGGAAANETFYIESDATNNEVDVYFYSTSTGATDASIHFTYEIL